ncbi:MAG TPA: glycosyltransferase family 39 protein [Kofleriaceae bacterium]|nr:glycosyltransferase family 39 protein [Kofleriaceae bacterium]
MSLLAKAAAAAVVIGLVLWAALVRWRFLAASPYPLGIDGYFYPIQLRSLLEHGTLYYPSSPLAIYLMAPLAALTDPITGAKLGAALGTAAIAIPMYLVGKRVSGDRAAGLMAAVLAVTSAESFYLTVEFVKNGFGLTALVAYLAVLGWALEAPSRRRWAAVGVALLAALLTHKMAATLAVVFTLPVAIVVARERGWRLHWSDRKVRGAAAGAAAAVAIAVAIGIAAPDRFVGAKDLALFGALFRADHDLTIPVLDIGRGRPLRFGHEAAIAGVLGLAVLAWILVRRLRGGDASSVPARDRALVIGPALLAAALAIPWLDISDPQGLPFRARLVAFVPLAICAAYLATALAARVSASTRAALLIGFAAGWIVSRPPTSTEGMVEPEAHMVAAMRAARDLVPPDHRVICPQRNLMFMYTWYTDRAARLRPEPVEPARRWRLLPSRLIHPLLIKAIDHLRAHPVDGIPPPRGLHPRHENGVILFRETTWAHLMTQVPPKVREIYLRWKTI